MKDNDLERVLMKTEEIVPSSGFVASVMDTVQREAAAPAPIPFPWKLALPGGIVSLLLTVGLVVRWLHSLAHMNQSPDSTMSVAISLENFSVWFSRGQIAASALAAMEWSVLALLVSLLAVWIPMHFIAGRD